MEPSSQQAHPVADQPGGAFHHKGPVERRALARPAVVIVIFLAGLLAGALLVRFGIERPALDAAQNLIQQQEQDLAALRGRLEQADKAAAALEGRLMVEEGTRRGLETSFRTLQAEFGQAKDTLAFYEQLVPPGPKGAVTIRALDIERAGPHLRYRVLLMRSGVNGKPFEGELQFVAEGRRNGETASIPLRSVVVQAQEAGDSPVAHGEPGERQDGGAPGAELLEVRFTDFQRASGLLGLPAGFEPESITLNVLEGRLLRASRSAELPTRD